MSPLLPTVHHHHEFFPYLSYFSFFFPGWSFRSPTLDAQQRSQGPPMVGRDWLLWFDGRAEPWPHWSLRVLRAPPSWRAFERLSVSGRWPRPCFPPRGVKPHHLLSLSLLLKETITGIKLCNRIITSHNNIIGLNAITMPFKVFVSKTKMRIYM